MGNRKKTISFSVSDDEYVIIEHEAKSKGLRIGQYVKTATFSNINRYPSKGTFAILHGMKGSEKPESSLWSGEEGFQDS